MWGNVKMIPAETTLGIGDRGLKESGWEGESMYDIFDIL
jgi:hypothetical protein